MIRIEDHDEHEGGREPSRREGGGEETVGEGKGGEGKRGIEVSRFRHSSRYILRVERRRSLSLFVFGRTSLNSQAV